MFLSASQTVHAAQRRHDMPELWAAPDASTGRAQSEGVMMKIGPFDVKTSKALSTDSIYFIGKPSADDYQRGRVLRIAGVDIVPSKCGVIRDVKMR